MTLHSSNCPYCSNRLFITQDFQLQKPDVSELEANCRQCGKKFIRDRSNKDYCSKACQMKYNNKGRAIKRRIEAAGTRPERTNVDVNIIRDTPLPCSACGTTPIIVTKENEHYVYCPKCYYVVGATIKPKDAVFVWNNPPEWLEIERPKDWVYPLADEKMRYDIKQGLLG